VNFDFFSPALRERKIDISGVENAILDFLVHVEPSDLGELGLAKGTMKLVGLEEQAVILKHVGGLEPEIEAGGACANALRVASRMGCRVCFSSAVGSDTNGALFAEEIERAAVMNRLVQVAGPTGTSVILVTPDGERTMNTHLGVCREYREEHVPLEEIRHSKIFFTTAYMWDTAHQIEAIEKAIREARAAGCRIALDLADPFAVERSRQALLSHLVAGLDLIFANREEARIMTGLEPDAACREMAKKATVSIVKDGANGAWIAHGPDLFHAKAQPVKVVDTTGAGDVFAAGFLAGLVGGQSLEVCAELATVLAADTIGHMGVKLSDDIDRRVENLLPRSS